MSLASQLLAAFQRVGQELKNARTISPGTNAYTPGWSDWGTPFITTLGKTYNGLVVLHFCLKKNAAIGQDTPIVLPAGFRPPANVSVVGVAGLYGSGGWGGTATFSLDSSGNLSIATVSVATATGIFGSITFRTV